MSIRKEDLPVVILKIWLNVSLLVGAVGGAILLLWLIASPVLMAGDAIPADGVVWVDIGTRVFKIVPVLPLDAQPATGVRDLGIAKANLVKGRGELRFTTTEWRLHFASLGSILLSLMVILFVIWSLRRILVNVQSGKTFALENSRYLRRSAFLLIGLAVLWPFSNYALSRYVLLHLDVNTLDLRPAFAFDSDALLVGLVLLVFSIILSRGHRLEQSTELSG
jgi:hypothetical protein